MIVKVSLKKDKWNKFENLLLMLIFCQSIMMKNIKLPIKQDFYKLKKTLTDQNYCCLYIIGKHHQRVTKER